MKQFFETLKNIYKIEDLRFRIGTTLFLLLIYRLDLLYHFPELIRPNCKI